MILTFVATVYHIDEPPISWKTQLAPTFSANKNGRKNRVNAPVTVLQHEMIWDRSRPPRYMPKFLPCRDQERCRVTFFQVKDFADLFSIFFLTFDSFAPLFKASKTSGDGVCLNLILVSWIWDERWMKKICAWRTLTCTSKVSEWTLRDLELVLNFAVQSVSVWVNVKLRLAVYVIISYNFSDLIMEFLAGVYWQLTVERSCNIICV